MQIVPESTYLNIYIFMILQDYTVNVIIVTLPFELQLLFHGSLALTLRSKFMFHTYHLSFNKRKYLWRENYNSEYLFKNISELSRILHKGILEKQII